MAEKYAMKRLFIYCIFLSISCRMIYGQVDSSLSVGKGSNALPEETVDTVSFRRLTEADFRRVADELGVDVAAMKAVVEIEAGAAHQGFAAPGIPLVNLDRVLFKRYLRNAGKNPAKYAGYEAFSRPSARKHGTFGKAQWARLESARTIDREAADRATFWGMFQIGGFNWKRCGAESLRDFVDKMSQSESMQLELFARFIAHNRRMVQALREKNWGQFAYRYNGPGYKRKGYHIRLARAYKKYQ